MKRFGFETEKVLEGDAKAAHYVRCSHMKGAGAQGIFVFMPGNFEDLRMMLRWERGSTSHGRDAHPPGQSPLTSGVRPCGRVMVGWYEVLESCANRLFHPIHRCTTIDVKGLQPQRTAVIFDSRGRQVVQDDEPEGEHSVAGGGTLAWIQVLPRGSSIRGRWNCDTKVLRGLQQEGLEVGTMVAMLMKKPRSMKKTAVLRR